MSKHHILFIPSWYPSTDAPLLGTFFQEQAEMFAEVGHKVGVLHARFHDLPSSTWLKGPTEKITITEHCQAFEIVHVWHKESSECKFC